MTTSPISHARKTASTLLREARDAGWVRLQLEIGPDGTVKIDAGLTDPDGADDFDTGNLRMGE